MMPLSTTRRLVFSPDPLAISFSSAFFGHLFFCSPCLRQKLTDLSDYDGARKVTG